MNRESDERRRARRLDGRDDHGVTGVRVRPGRDVALVDVSAGGLLVETLSRLLPGSPIDLQLLYQGRPVGIRGLVLRCAVTELRANAITYRGAIQFERSLQCLEGKLTACAGTDYPA